MGSYVPRSRERSSSVRARRLLMSKLGRPPTMVSSVSQLRWIVGDVSVWYFSQICEHSNNRVNLQL
eukprot:6356259-Pyramimonas_sp.AAC.1